MNNKNEIKKNKNSYNILIYLVKIKIGEIIFLKY
jgi:hypothetical protein